jgi:hypothetical protein
MFLDIVMGRKNQVGLAWTPQAITVLDTLAEHTQLSRADVIEAIAQARIQILTDTAEWAVRLQPGDDHPQVEVLDPQALATPAATPPAPPPPEPPAPTPVDTAATDRLQSEVTALHSQLQEARSHIQNLQFQLQEQAAAPAPAPEPVPVPVVAPPTPAPALVSGLQDGVVKGLQEQLLNTRAAYAELETQLKQQQAENDRLQQALIEAQQVATIGSSQLNRWQYKTFSR